MGSPLDTSDMRAMHSLLHDLGHEMTALSYLVEAVRNDVSLPEDSSYRLELLSLEISRLRDLVSDGLASTENHGHGGRADLREMLTELTRLASLTHGAQVELLPSPGICPELSTVLLWRVLSNVIDNAARAAGPGGRVTVEIREEAMTVIEVTDDGPGFGSGPAGTASLGLKIVTSLLETCDGALEVESPAGGGTVARVLLPGPVATCAGMPRGDRW
jgi:signal transduction histidine kinase